MHAPGDVLGDRYTLKKSEWRTPIGPVWLARDKVLDRAVLVQLLDGEVARDEDASRAFLRGAARAAQVAHPGLLQVFDIGQDPAFVVLEHAAGGRLSDRLRAGPLRTADAVRAALALARGLEALHERGSWHGSLAPEAVLFDDEGRAKILAVGITEATAVPGIGVVAEQPDGYRPDDLDSLPVDHDRFALAALTYHMLTGRPPGKDPPPARQVRRDVPADVDALLRRALDDQPANRPTSDAFVAALAPHARVVPREAERGPRVSGSEFRWLLPVALILILGAVAATFGVAFVRDLTDRSDATPSPTPTGPVTGAPIQVASVTDFDPEANGGNGEEHPGDVGKATDGDPRTAWRTLDYAARDLAPKDGVGLLFDLGEARDLARIRVQSTLPGWKAEIRVADEPGDEAGAFGVVASFTAGIEEDVAVPPGTRVRYVLLWLVELTEHEGGSNLPYRGDVAEVEFFTR